VIDRKPTAESINRALSIAEKLSRRSPESIGSTDLSNGNPRRAGITNALRVDNSLAPTKALRDRAEQCALVWLQFAHLCVYSARCSQCLSKLSVGPHRHLQSESVEALLSEVKGKPVVRRGRKASGLES
jgi:hypothetical protein